MDADDAVDAVDTVDTVDAGGDRSYFSKSFGYRHHRHHLLDCHRHFLEWNR